MVWIKGAAEQTLAAADHYCDYIPVVSTVSNLIDLLAKCIILPFLSQERVTRSFYLSYLNQKSAARCAAAAIPIFGNAAVGFYDSKFDNKKMPAKPAAVAPADLKLAAAADEPVAAAKPSDKAIKNVEDFILEYKTKGERYYDRKEKLNELQKSLGVEVCPVKYLTAGRIMGLINLRRDFQDNPELLEKLDKVFPGLENAVKVCEGFTKEAINKIRDKL